MPSIEYQYLLEIIAFWGYPLMFLLMIVEGPIATLGAAFMASMGFFNVFIVLALSIIGDLIADVILYGIGFFSKNGIGSKKRKVWKPKSETTKMIKEGFEKKGPQLVFFTKATIGLSAVTFILAGMTRLNFKKFLFYSLLGGIFWSSFIVALGYYFGWLAEEIEKYIKFSGWFIFLFAVLIVSTIVIYNKSKALKKYKFLKKTNAKKRKWKKSKK